LLFVFFSPTKTRESNRGEKTVVVSDLKAASRFLTVMGSKGRQREKEKAKWYEGKKHRSGSGVCFEPFELAALALVATELRSAGFVPQPGQIACSGLFETLSLRLLDGLAVPADAFLGHWGATQ
jgi:hypothetical protein